MLAGGRPLLGVPGRRWCRGIVANLEFRLNNAGPEVMHTQVFCPMEQALEALTFYRDSMTPMGYSVVEN